MSYVYTESNYCYENCCDYFRSAFRLTNSLFILFSQSCKSYSDNALVVTCILLFSIFFKSKLWVFWLRTELYILQMKYISFITLLRRWKSYNRWRKRNSLHKTSYHYTYYTTFVTIKLKYNEKIKNKINVILKEASYLYNLWQRFSYSRHFINLLKLDSIFVSN